VRGLQLAAALSFIATAGPAWSAGIQTVPAVQLHVTSDLGIDRLFDAAAMGCVGDTAYSGGYAVSCNGYDYDLGSATLSSLNANFVVDPEVHLNISLINNSNLTQTFTLVALLPTDPFAGPNRMGGSLTGGITETNGNTASLTAVTGNAIYTALIDGNPVATLLPAPYTLSVANAFESSPIPAGTAFGQPIPSAAAPSVVGELGLRYQFRLSPGDQVALSGVFVVQTPEPALSGLLGLAALALVALRRVL
jgi:hypothetical protein